MKINCEISGLGLHGRRCKFSKLSEWGKPSSVLDEELAACSQATLKQRRLPREDWRIQEPRDRDKASVYLCFRPRPPPQYKPPGVVSTLRHSAWFYGSPNSHKEQTWHDMTYGTSMTNSWHCVSATLCVGFMRLLMSLNAI